MAYQKRPWHQKTDPLPTGTSIKADQVGITHIGLWVDNLDAVYAALKSQGVPFVVPPHVLLQTPTGGVRSAFALDPDGILVHSMNLLGTRRSDGRSMVAHQATEIACMMDLETAAAPPLSQKTHTFQGLNCLTYVYVRFGAVRYVDKRELSTAGNGR